MNGTRMIVIALVGLVIGVMLGFGFRGSLADILNLDAYFIPQQVTQQQTAGTTFEQAAKNVAQLKQFGLTETDFYGNATGVQVPVVITLEPGQNNSLLGGNSFLPAPTLLSFDLGTMTAAEKVNVDTCMDASTDQNPPPTFSGCLVEHVIKTRATTPQ